MPHNASRNICNEETLNFKRYYRLNRSAFCLKRLAHFIRNLHSIIIVNMTTRYFKPAYTVAH